MTIKSKFWLKYFIAFTLMCWNLVPYAGGNMQLWVSLSGYILGFGLLIWLLVSETRKPIFLGIASPFLILLIAKGVISITKLFI